MKLGEHVYIKGPMGTYANGFNGEIGEIVEILEDIYPERDQDHRDLYRVAFDPEAIERCPNLQRLTNPDFWRLESASHLAFKGDKRFGILFYTTELEGYPQSPVVG